MTKRPDTLFLNGELVPYENATVHTLSPAVKYGALIFEGIRAYWNESQEDLYIFRAEEHLDRLFESAKIARITIPYTKQELLDSLLRLIISNNQKQDLHIRINAYVDTDNGAMDSTEPISVSMATLPMGRYDTKDTGLDVCISSWARISEAAMPPRIKSAANYHNSRLALLQAKTDGYDDAILLDGNGKLTEGPGYNVFLIRAGRVYTPAVTNGILEGITRATLLTLFSEQLGMHVQERDIDRTELYIAEEAFFCGSGKEIKSIASVDRLQLGDGNVGEITTRIREAYMDVVRGANPKYQKWLLPVYN